MPPRRLTRPMTYGRLTQLSDMTWGWLDGIRGLPRVPENLPASESLWLRTPRLEAIVREAREAIEYERIACIEDCDTLKEELSQIFAVQEAASVELRELKARLEQVHHPLPADGLVQARGAQERRRRQALVQREYHVAARRLDMATNKAAQLHESISARVAVAQSRARTHQDFALRRISTYMRQLIRMHRLGPDLREVLVRQADPDLPEWVSDPQSGDLLSK